MTDDLLELARARGAAADALTLADEKFFRALAGRVRAGERVNVAEVARRAVLSRQTIYNRLEAVGIRAGDLDT